MEYALDKKAICDSVALGYWAPVYQLSVPGSLTENKDIKGYQIPNRNIICIPPEDENWSTSLTKVDIGLIPNLEEHDGNWLPAMEFMVMKTPWIASSGPVFQDLRSYGWLVSNSASMWHRIITDMVTNLESYKKDAEGEPYLFALSQSLEENLERVLGTFQKFYNKNNKEMEDKYAGEIQLESSG
jgi:hypothetical protein